MSRGENPFGVTLMEQLAAFAPFVKGERSWEGQGEGAPVLVKWGEYERGCWPDCPRVLAAGESPKFLVRELHPGPSLKDLAPLETGEVLNLFAKILTSLHNLHENGIVHGRLKPSNIFAAGLTDPGLMVPETDPLALQFRAPELNGTRSTPIGIQADLYSAGAVLYFMLAGAPPFVADNLSQALRAPFLQPIPALVRGKLDPCLYRGIDAIVARLMSIEPKDRYTSAAEVKADLLLLQKAPENFAPGMWELRDQLAPPAFVGRSDIVAQLDQHLDEGGLLQIFGQAGSGKSRLADQAHRLARSKGFLILRAQAHQQTADAPLQLFDEICQELLSQSSEPELEQLLSDLAHWRPVVCAALPVLGESGYHGPEAYAWIRTRKALSLFLEALGTPERPVLVILEDLHWSPPDTLEVLSDVSGSKNVAILITSRRELGLSGAHLEVTSLSPAEAERTARSMLGRCDASIPPALAAASEGNPYRLISLLRHEVQQGSLRPTTDGWVALDRFLESRPTGETTANLLDHSAQKVLSLAAVVGREFESQFLSYMFDSSLLEQALTQSAALGLVQNSSPGTWRFTHELTREAVLAWQPTSRRGLHVKVAKTLCRYHPEREHDIAYHFHQAGMIAQAYPFARRAAITARQRNAFSAAETYLHIALTAAPEEQDLWEELGDVQRLVGNFEPAHHSYKRALSSTLEPLSRARILGRRAETAFGAGELDLARDLFKQALALLGHNVPLQSWKRNLALMRELLSLARPQAHSGKLCESTQLALKLLDRLAYVLVYTDGFGLVWANLRCLNLARRAAPDRELGIALITHAVATLYVPPLLARSKRVANRALSLLERVGTEHDRAAAMARAASVALFSDNPTEAVRLDELAAPILQRSGDRYDAHMVSYNLGLALYFLGQLERSRSVLRENLQECMALGDSLGCGYTLRVLGLVEPLSEELISSVKESPTFPSVRVLLSEVRGLHHLQKGELQASITQLECASKAARQIGDIFESLWSDSFLVRARRLLAQQEQKTNKLGLELLAEKAGLRALKLARKGYLVFIPRLCRELALLQIQQGRIESARELLEQGLSAARQCKMRFEEALALAELAEISRLGGTPFEEQLADARRLFRLTGTTWERSPSEKRPPGVALAERFDQVIHWSQAIASRHSSSEVLETARQAAEALLRCRCIRLPSSDSDREVRTVSPRESDTLSALLIPLSWAKEQTEELYCSSRDLEEFFGPEEFRLAGLIQGQARVALSNAHLWTEIREREAHLQQLFSSVPAGIAVVDSYGIVLQDNPRLTEMLGCSPLNSELVEHLQPDDRRWFGEALQSLDSTGVLQRELRLNLPEGRSLWGELSLQRLPGSEKQAIVALADVSQRRLEQIAIFQDRERHMLASEVHDVLSQPLVALHLRLEALSSRHPEAQTALRDSAQTTRDVLDDARELISRLRSPHVEHLKLSLAIDDAVAAIIDLPTTDVRVDLGPGLDSLSPLVTLFAYRIVVEALTNCKRHSQADKVRLRLRLQKGWLCGTIADNGVGFCRDDAAPGHFGLRIVGERAELLGGRSLIRSASGRGTAVLFRLPTEQS